MGVYNVRDRMGHWIERKRKGKKCPHWWCRTREMSEAELLRHLEANHDDHRARIIVRELDRREERDKRRARKASDRAGRQEEHTLAVETAYVAAETETRGHMLSRAGRAAGVNPRSLWTGPEARARRYASEELRAYWDKHGRLTKTEWNRQAEKEREIAEYEDDRSRRLYGVY